MTRRNRTKIFTQPRLGLEALETREVPASALGLGAGATANTLFRFDTAAPTTIQATIPITGLAAGEIVVGIDFRPATGQLYGLAVDASGLGTNAQLIRINPVSGLATDVGTPITVTAGDGYGFDFNPTVDRIRVVNSSDENLRIDPDTGARADTPVNDTDLNPSGAGIDAVAYDRNAPGGGATGTTLYAINTGAASLQTIGSVNQTPLSPNTGTLATVGPLGVTVDANGFAGFDIGNTGTNTAQQAFAVLDGDATATVASGLYSINLGTGAATLIGLVGTGANAYQGFAIVPNLAPIVVGGPLDGTVQLITSVAGTAGAPVSVTVFPGLNVNVRATTGDVNGDNVEDIIAVTGPGTPIRFTVLSGVNNSTVLIPPQAPFLGSEGFTGGGFVSSGDFNNDGVDEIVVSPDQGGGPRVTVFTLVGSTPTVVANFFGITGDPNFRGGVRTAVGDVNNDGTVDLAVAAGFLGGPRVTLFNGTSVIGATQTKMVNDFFAFPGTDSITLRNGSYVAIGDLNGDGFGEMIFGGGPGGAPRVFALNGQLIAAANIQGAYDAPISNFFVAGNSADRGGVRVATTNADGDDHADLVVGSGENNSALVRLYLGSNITSPAEPAVFQDISVFGGAFLTGGVFVG